MSAVSYNGVYLPYCFISKVGQNAAYDDSDTDRIGTDFDVQVQATLNWNYLSILSPTLWNGGTPLTTNPANAMNAIRNMLLVPRKQLSVKFAGVELIPQITGNTGTVDAANGPKPRSCDIIQMTDTTFLLSYHIQARYVENPTVNGQTGKTTHAQGGDVLSNRWSESVDIDECGYSTRTRTGKFIIRSDNQSRFIADQCRAQMAVLSIPSGFTRQSSRYTVDPSGLAIEYSITDREEFKMPPEPAFKASGTYTETIGRGAAIKTVECKVSLKGSRDTSQKKLVETAIGICASKVDLNTPMPPKRKGVTIFGGLPPKSDKQQKFTRILEEARCEIGLYENTVDCYLRIMAPISNNRIQALSFANMDTVTPGSDGKVYTPNYKLRGSASILLQAAAYYDPTLDVAIGAGTTTSSINPLREIGPGKTQLPGTEPGQGGAE